jgi:hypothetical protein
LLQALTAYLTLPGEPIFNAWTVNVNVLSLPHVDGRNTASSAIFCLGDFEGGRLCVERDEYTGNKRRWRATPGRAGTARHD